MAEARSSKGPIAGLGLSGSAASYPSGVLGGDPAAKRFSCIPGIPDGLSWDLLGQVRATLALPFNPPIG